MLHLLVSPLLQKALASHTIILRKGIKVQIEAITIEELVDMLDQRTHTHVGTIVIIRGTTMIMKDHIDTKKMLILGLRSLLLESQDETIARTKRRLPQSYLGIVLTDLKETMMIDDTIIIVSRKLSNLGRNVRSEDSNGIEACSMIWMMTGIGCSMASQKTTRIGIIRISESTMIYLTKPVDMKI